MAAGSPFAMAQSLGATSAFHYAALHAGGAAAVASIKSFHKAASRRHAAIHNDAAAGIKSLHETAAKHHRKTSRTRIYFPCQRPLL